MNKVAQAHICAKSPTYLEVRYRNLGSLFADLVDGPARSYDMVSRLLKHTAKSPPQWAGRGRHLQMYWIYSGDQVRR